LQADRDKWNARYSGGDGATSGTPNPLLLEWLPAIAPVSSPPRALDVACGLGRHALYLARRGWQVDAMDISDVALASVAATAAAEGLDVTCIQADFEPEIATAASPFAPDRYDLAVMMRYTNLPLIGHIAGALRVGGYLVAEAYLKSDTEDAGPRNPNYRVSSGELRDAVAALETVAYRERLETERSGPPAALAQLVARRR
jgi:SAM-dependent methyltransferase